jgi:hypothetical protein
MRVTRFNTSGANFKAESTCNVGVQLTSVNRMQTYYNYVRSHEALDGKTPSEAAGIEVKGVNKWLTLIQNATRKDR